MMDAAKQARRLRLRGVDNIFFISVRGRLTRVELIEGS